MPIPKSLILETPRLRLRIPASEDNPYVFSATLYPGFNDGMLWDPPAKEADLVQPLGNSLQAWEEGKAYTFTIEDKDSGQFLGRIAIRKTGQEGTWNVGFWTHPRHQGRGIMTEAVKAIIDFGFEQLNAREVEACYALWNKASERVLQKNGMQFVRHIEQGFLKKGEWVEENLLAIQRSDWESESA